ncbi:MAG: hypothetical protein MJ206_00980 [Bacilli bacterium]|nr:hypothetical protein [Bacilli bacterium]
MKTVQECIQDFLSKIAEGVYVLESEADLVLKFVVFLRENFKDDINRYVLEKPFCELIDCKCSNECQIFNKKSGRKRALDLYYNHDKQTCIFEFKYHRKGSVSTSTDASEILLDLKRLSLLNKDEETKKYFIYVTDEIMNDYFINRTRKDYFDFYNNGDGKFITEVNCCEDKALKRVFKDNSKKIRLKRIKINLNSNNTNDIYYVRAYEVFSN